MRQVDYHGYTIYENGKVIGLYGKEIKKRERNGRYEIRLNIEGLRKDFTVSRLVYHAFENFDIADTNLCVTHKDGDKLNVDFKNLKLVKRKELIQGEGHKTRISLSNAEVDEIRSLYKGKAGVNQYDRKGFSLQQLADKFGVTKGNIMQIVKGVSRNEENYKLK